MIEVSTELEKYLLATEFTKHNVVDAAQEIRDICAQPLDQYLGEDFRIAERVVKNGH